MEPTHGIETLEPTDIANSSEHAGTHPRQRHVLRTAEDGNRFFVKVATTSGRDELRREAEVLEALRGPEVVSLVSLVDGPDSTELTVRDTGGPSLSAALSAPTTSAGDGMRLIAAACRTVASLHAKGWAHGRMCTDHVLLTARGRVRLCSLADASPVQVDPATAHRDRVALLRMVDALTEQHRRLPASRTPERIQSGLLARRTARLPDDPDPLVLARILDRSAGPRPPRMDLHKMNLHRIYRHRIDWRVLRRAGLAIGAAALVALLTSIIGSSSGESDTTSSSTAVPSDATISAGTVIYGGRTYRVGGADDLIAVGDWDCDGVATVAMIADGSDEVQVFDTWATETRPATARTIGRVEQATSISATGSGCGPPSVTTSAGRRFQMEEVPP